jgi:hypothetical protein
MWRTDCVSSRWLNISQNRCIFRAGFNRATSHKSVRIGRGLGGQCPGAPDRSCRSSIEIACGACIAILRQWPARRAHLREPRGRTSRLPVREATARAERNEDLTSRGWRHTKSGLSMDNFAPLYLMAVWGPPTGCEQNTPFSRGATRRADAFHSGRTGVPLPPSVWSKECADSPGRYGSTGRSPMSRRYRPWPP